MPFRRVARSLPEPPRRRLMPAESLSPQYLRLPLPPLSTRPVSDPVIVQPDWRADSDLTPTYPTDGRLGRAWHRRRTWLGGLLALWFPLRLLLVYWLLGCRLRGGVRSRHPRPSSLAATRLALAVSLVDVAHWASESARQLFTGLYAELLAVGGVLLRKLWARRLLRRRWPRTDLWRRLVRWRMSRG
jgi:hypothetical protein